MSQINDKILLTEKKNGVGIITLNRPDKLNSFNDELSFQLQDALKEMEKDYKRLVLLRQNSIALQRAMVQ